MRAGARADARYDAGGDNKRSANIITNSDAEYTE